MIQNFVDEFFFKHSRFLSLVHQIDLLHIHNVFSAFDIFCKNHSHYTPPFILFYKKFYAKIGCSVIFLR